MYESALYITNASEDTTGYDFTNRTLRSMDYDF